MIYIGLMLGILLLLPDEIPLMINQSLKIPKMSAIFTQKAPQNADISHLVQEFGKSDSEKNKNIVKKTDRKNKKFKSQIIDTLSLNPELRIQYPENQEELLHGFFESLQYLEENQDTLIRVVHFGDSQLEGDRITAFLREKFQEEFGGCGVGTANLVDKLQSKTSIVQTASASWVQQVVYGPQYRKANPNYYGILGDVHRFAVPAKPQWSKATVTYIKSPYATPTQQKVENLKIFYRNPDAPFELTVNTPQGQELKQKIDISEQFSVYTHSLSTPFERVEIGFATGSKSPEIYGVALDCKRGITFDNVPLRGSSGVEFSRFNKAHLKRQLELLNVKLLILQFGVNIVPNPQPDYTFYENMFYNELTYLKSLMPDLSILVVGVSDMSRNVTGNYESYPNIEKIRNAQKKAAFRANCAFWDLYEAMGGKNSMPSWVFAKPEALANKDFTHFTSKGASIVSEMLYKALLTEYKRFNEYYN
ncbi:MAG: hypothetical protein NW226_24550 [Microscillaceae bacterium]|nr:hypothetical protein [Microscillaceae bacterium]